MSRLEQNIKDCITRNGLLDDGATVVVAVSGGADSVALLNVLVSLGYHCIVAHCDFHLRGEESERDRRYVKSLASRYGVECRVVHFDVPAYEKEHGVSTEMACRELRYGWFEQLRNECGASAIAVAHHRDDNIETFFLNLLRGTGIAGLSGMSPRNGYIIRPMLDCTRAEIEEYLNDCGIDYVIDSTNRLNDFKRNKLRNIILPVLREQFPGADNAIAATISMLRDNESVYLDAIVDKDKEYRKGNRIDLKNLLRSENNPVVVLFEILRPFGFNATHARDIVASADLSGRRFYSNAHVALLNRGELVVLLRDCQCDDTDEYVIDLSSSVDAPLKLGVAIEKCSEKNVKPVDSGTLLLDASVLDGNPHFMVRRWRKGDRIAPFGMKGSKKVSDIFSDAKLSLDEKAKVWVLTRNDEILWVVGYRASRHFPVTSCTQNVLEIRWLD